MGGIDKNALLQSEQYTDKYTTDTNIMNSVHLYMYISVLISISVYTQNIFTYILQTERYI